MHKTRQRTPNVFETNPMEFLIAGPTLARFRVYMNIVYYVHASPARLKAYCLCENIFRVIAGYSRV